MAQKVYSVTTNNFVYDETIGKYVYHVTDLAFSSMNFKMEKLLRGDTEAGYKNVIVAYEILPDKTMKVYSDEAFAGRMVVNTDT